MTVNQQTNTKYDCVIIGAGPAGLTAAYLLCQNNKKVLVLEQDRKYVGGISRTVEYKGFRFDIGGHRFFTKSKEVNQFWREILPNDFIQRPRSSRIYYQNTFFQYPLKPMEALFKLGIWQAFICVVSYFRWRLFPYKTPKSFEQWVTNNFGKHLFEIFFKTYTEKVWGMKCSEISADWASQRIRGLSLWRAILNGIPFFKKQQGIIKTLTDKFDYPRLGPGMMWEACAEKIKSMGGLILMGASLHKLIKTREDWEVKYQTNTNLYKVTTDHIISSAGLGETLLSLEPGPSQKSIEAAKSLKHRHFITVVLMFRGKPQFDDQWVYIHDPTVSVGRIQNFVSWSPEMVPDENSCSFGLEYFCSYGDKLWEKSDDQLIALARNEFPKIGLEKDLEYLMATVVRQPKAYPVYDDHYQQHVDNIRNEIETRFPNLHPVGRNGMHKYNNQDHAVMTAMLTVKNILANKKQFDVWQVNQDAEYHEESLEKSNHTVTSRLLPKKLAQIVVFFALTLTSQTIWANCEKCNVILISMDTLGAKHLGIYGSKTATSPNIDAFAQKAWVYKNAYTTAPWTLPSHGSMLTGMYPWNLYERGQFGKLRADIPTLAEIFKKAKYRTVAFTDGSYLTRDFHFHRGFDVFKDRDYFKNRGSISDHIERALTFIQTDKVKPFFLFLHSFDMHEPFAPSKESIFKLFPNFKGQEKLDLGRIYEMNTRVTPVTQSETEWATQMYQAALLDFDARLGKLLNYINTHLTSNTIVILTSDHGEEFGEHGSWGIHGQSLYQELMKIPLIVYFPNQVTKQIESNVSLIDIVPTLVQTLRLNQKKELDGKPLPITDNSSSQDRIIMGSFLENSKPILLELIINVLTRDVANPAKFAIELGKLKIDKLHPVYMLIQDKIKFLLNIKKQMHTSYDLLKDSMETKPQNRVCESALCEVQGHLISNVLGEEK